MIRADLLLKGISELVTMKWGPYRRVRLEDAGIIRDAALAIKSGRIVWVGKESESSIVKSDRTVNLGGRVVTPAFIDSHTHLVFSGDRSFELWMKLEGKSYLEILEAGGGIYYTVRETRKREPESLADEAMPRVKLMMREGSGVIEAKTGYGLLPEYEYRMLQAINLLKGRMSLWGPEIVPTILAHVIPEEYKEKREEYVELFANEIVPKAAEMGAVYADVFCDKGAFTVDETRRILDAAVGAGLKLRLHSDELANIGCHKLALEYEIHSLDHLEYLPESFAKHLAETRTVATLLPTSMLSVFSSKKPPLEALRKEGVYIGIATDFNPNNMTPSMQEVLDLAIYTLRLSPIEAIAAGTINSAFSLDLHREYGKIEEGYHANIIVWDLDNVKQIGYYWGYDRILEVFNKGKPVRGEEL